MPDCGNGNSPAEIVPGGVAVNGSRVFFLSFERLVAGDTDSALDVYVRDFDIEATILVSTGAASCAPACGNGPAPVLGFEGAARDGSRVFFTTEEGLAGGDGDGLRDIYVRDLDGATTQLVSMAGACPGDLQPGQNCEPTFGGASADGLHAFFETNERLSGADADSFQDVYDWSAGTVTLASTGPEDDGSFNALYAGASADGKSVFVETGEPLDPALDEDEAQDVYERSAGSTTLISHADASCAGSCGNGSAPATLRWVSPDGSSAAAIFSSDESLSADDGDGTQDAYSRGGGKTTLLSRGDASCAGSGCGDGPFDAIFAGASHDGSHAFFVSDEVLGSGDADAAADIYERVGGATNLISTGPLPGKGIAGGNLAGIAEDGSTAFFVTEERLTVDDDFAGEDDVYSRSESGTLLVSVGNDPGLKIGPPPPTLTGTNPTSPNASTQPALLGTSEAGASIKLYSTPDCSGEPIATGSAAQLASPGIVVAVATGSTTSFRATAEVAGITSPCSNAVTYAQASEPPPPPPPGEETGGGSGSGSTGGGTNPGDSKPGPVFLVPRTRITFAPAGLTRERRPTFRFTDATGQEGTSFHCKVDRGRWRGCRSPLRLKTLSRGRHAFQVRAVNGGGVLEPKPVKRSFKVVAP